jgi:DNA-binding IclR family transcriptional regulator
MLAFLPPDELQETLRRMPLEALTPHTITSRAEFTKHLAQVRQQGYSLDLGETVEGHHCLGAPVFDADERPLAAIWITAPTPRLSAADGKRLAPHVIKAAQMITKALR